MMIMVVNAVGMGVGALGLLLGLLQAGDPSVLGSGALSIAIGLGFFRLGKELRDGHRRAVYGLCILGGLVLLVGLALLVTVAVPAFGVMLLLGAGLLYLPPIISAFSHWDAFA